MDRLKAEGGRWKMEGGRLKTEVYQSYSKVRIKPFKTFSVSKIFGSIRDESWFYGNQSYKNWQSKLQKLAIICFFEFSDHGIAYGSKGLYNKNFQEIRMSKEFSSKGKWDLIHKKMKTTLSFHVIKEHI